MDAVMEKRYYRIPVPQIAYLRFTLESYDGLGTVRTLDREGAVVEIAFPPSMKEEACALLEALCIECAMVELSEPPEDIPPL